MHFTRIVLKKYSLILSPAGISAQCSAEVMPRQVHFPVSLWLISTVEQSQTGFSNDEYLRPLVYSCRKMKGWQIYSQNTLFNA